MALPFLIFWLLLFFGRDDWGFKGIVILIAIWIDLLVGLVQLNETNASYIFVAAQALLDVILILKLFGGDIKIR